MALKKNLFFKVTAVVLADLSGSTAIYNEAINNGNLNLAAYNYRVETVETADLDKVVVYYEGQAIPGGASPVTPTSKYYYEITSTLAPADMTSYMSGNTVPTDTSTVAFSIKINDAFVSPGYVNSSGGSASFATNVMTLNTAPTTGSIAINQTILTAAGGGVTGGTTITGLLSGAWNGVGSTYSLSTTPGTLGDRAITTGISSLASVEKFVPSDSFMLTYFYTTYTVI